MRTGPGIILQARFSSSRLPGKALAVIGRQTMLEHCLRRLMSPGVAPVVLATTNRPEDDALDEIARELGVGVFRGDEDDVLGRYVSAAAAFDFDTIIRATGDNPCVDLQAPGRVLEVLRTYDSDYACEDGLPYGGAVEAVTRAALVRAADEAHHVEDREHVTVYVRRNTKRFRVVQVSAPPPLRRPDVRVTVDTAADLERVRRLYARTGEEMPSLLRIIAVAGRTRVRAEVA
jgi:spore coat polysaccharide biosynthesis protein SpsF